MSAYIPATLRQEVKTQFNHCCVYCRTAEKLTATTFEIEHIIPPVANGETELSNLCFACPTCNRHKGTRQTAVDPQTNIITTLFHPQQKKWGAHFAWNEDNTELDSGVFEPESQN